MVRWLAFNTKLPTTGVSHSLPYSPHHNPNIESPSSLPTIQFRSLLTKCPARDATIIFSVSAASHDTAKWSRPLTQTSTVTVFLIFLDHFDR